MIALDAVAKSYPTPVGRRLVLDDATAEFAAGYNFGILGANGAGKSTLIRLLAGTEMPDRGTIRRHVRVSFPLGYDGTFHPALSGRENVAFIARVYGAGCRRRPSALSRNSPSSANISRCRSTPTRPACGRGSPLAPAWRSISTST